MADRDMTASPAPSPPPDAISGADHAAPKPGAKEWREQARELRTRAETARDQAREARAEEQRHQNEWEAARRDMNAAQDRAQENVRLREAKLTEANEADRSAGRYDQRAREGGAQLAEVERKLATEKDPEKAADLAEQASRTRQLVEDYKERAGTLRQAAQSARQEARRLDEEKVQLQTEARAAIQRLEDAAERSEAAESRAEALEKDAATLVREATDLDTKAEMQEQAERVIAEAEGGMPDGDAALAAVEVDSELADSVLAAVADTDAASADDLVDDGVDPTSFVADASIGSDGSGLSMEAIAAAPETEMSTLDDAPLGDESMEDVQMEEPEPPPLPEPDLPEPGPEPVPIPYPNADTDYGEDI